MKRLIRCIAELESFRKDLIDRPWKTPRENLMLTWTYTAINAIFQIKFLAESSPHPKIEAASAVNVLIDQINDELRDLEENDNVEDGEPSTH